MPRARRPRGDEVPRLDEVLEGALIRRFRQQPDRLRVAELKVSHAILQINGACSSVEHGFPNLARVAAFFDHSLITIANVQVWYRSLKRPVNPRPHCTPSPGVFTMSRTSFAARTIIASVALTALGLAAASPASAHTNNLFTVVTESDDAGLGYASMNKAHGQLTLLPDSVDISGYILGIEVAGEKGTAVYDASEADYVVASWNHYTGEPGVPVAVHMADPAQIVSRVYGLDTLNNGT